MSCTESSTDATHVVTIDPGGEVHLILTNKNGLEPPPTVKLRVSSTVLSLASPVFKVTFSNKFAEGNNLRANAKARGRTIPAEVPLPEDDSRAMTLLCQILHHQFNQKEHGSPSLEELGGLALLCHKYDCARVLLHHSKN